MFLDVIAQELNEVKGQGYIYILLLLAYSLTALLLGILRIYLHVGVGQSLELHKGSFISEQAETSFASCHPLEHYSRTHLELSCGNLVVR